jgi:DNA polymerase-1
VVAIDLDTGEVHRFVGDEIRERFPAFSKRVTLWVGHNFLSYDAPALNKLVEGVSIQVGSIRDTLIMARILNPYPKGGNGLGAWGLRLGFPKTEYSDFSKYTPEMLWYCENDTQLTARLYKHLLKELRDYSHLSLDLEHHTQHILNVCRNHGFYLDTVKALDIYEECKTKADLIEYRLKEVFPPRHVLDTLYTPRYNKDGTMSKASASKIAKASRHEVLPNGEYKLYRLEEFNLGSTRQVISRLDEAGWKPTRLTKNGSPQVCEENLATVPASHEGAKQLADWLVLRSRTKVIQNWMDYYDPVTKRVHGDIISLGASTHRMAHRNPQMGNIPAVRSLYGEAMRSCWTVEDTVGYCMVGTDIEGIQLRILAHLMGNPAYIDAVANGDKRNGTDVHSVNMRVIQEVAAWCDRDMAKTFIYAMILGAGNVKLGQILGGNGELGRRAKDLLFNRIDGFKRVQSICAAAAKRGYMVAIDGRRIPVPSEHLALAIYLQANEAIVMKYALGLVRRRARHLDWHLLTVVHDEMQSEVLKIHAEELGRIQVQAIIDAGESLGLKCPLNGEYKIGSNWAETH